MRRPTTCLFSILLCLGGCGVSKPVISITTLQSHEHLRQEFTRAYTARDAAGDYQAVLINDPIDIAPSSQAGQPLSPAAAPPIRQVLEIRLLWRPVQGASADSAAATNAILHWYVLGSLTAEGMSILHYKGTAFVTVVSGGPGAEVTIRNGLLKLAERRGDLNDPLQAFRIDGRFDAITDDARLRQTLGDVKSALGEPAR